MFRNNMEKVFEEVGTYLSPAMEGAITEWLYLEEGFPKLLNGYTPEEYVQDDLLSIRFPNLVAHELATLITQGIDIRIESRGKETATVLQKAIDKYFADCALEVMERVLMVGGLVAKYNGEGFDYISPDSFLVTSYNSEKKMTGGIFFSYATVGNWYYTRAEWHRFDGTDPDGRSIYKISNRCFKSRNGQDVGKPATLSEVPEWAGLEPEMEFHGLEKPLFVYIKTPRVNTVDAQSPYGESIFQKCLPVLDILDTAMSCLNRETKQSMPIMAVDDTTMVYARDGGIKLPPFVKSLGRPSTDSFVQQWQPTLQTEERLKTINWAISYISVSTGFDPGHFAFNGNMVTVNTATQVEAMERHTINTVLAYRKMFDRPEKNGDGRIGYLHDLLYILDAMYVMQGLLPPNQFGNYQIYADFADLTSNEEEDRAFDYQLSQNGYMSKARFLVKHCGVTMEQAIEMVEEAKAEAGASEAVKEEEEVETDENVEQGLDTEM